MHLLTVHRQTPWKKAFAINWMKEVANSFPTKVLTSSSSLLITKHPLPYLSSTLILPERPSSLHHGESRQEAEKACIPRTEHDWTRLPAYNTGSQPRLFFQPCHRGPAKPDHGWSPTCHWNHYSGQHRWAKRRTENPTRNWEPSSLCLYLKQHPGTTKTTTNQNQVL